MDLYSLIKTVHIISSTVLFGTGLGIAFFFYRANKGESSLAARYFAARNTVKADFLFTLPVVILQPLTGVWLVKNGGYHGNETWLLATYGLYMLAGICWLPVVWIQIRMRNLLRQSIDGETRLPPQYRKLFRVWFLLGWPAFIGLVIVFYLMVAKPA